MQSDWPSWFDFIRLLAVPALVLLNGFFVAAEFALVAVRRTRVETFVREKRRGSKLLQEQITSLDRSIAATQLGITLASLALGWIGEPALARLITPLFYWLGEGWALTAFVHTIATVVAFLLITIMHVVLGELAPKTLALQRPDQIALRVAWPLEVFIRCTRPLVISMNNLGNWVVKRMGMDPIHGSNLVHSVDELAMIVDEVEEAGLLSEDQATYVVNVFRLASKKVADCMVPVEKMAALDLHMEPEQILEKVREGAHTRMPVYAGHIDNIVGVVNTKDLFHLFSLRNVVILQDAIYAPQFVKPEQLVADALRLFKQTHRPMALVRSEEGKVLGLITLEDILEEIVGDIEDEHDRPSRSAQIQRINLHKLAPLIFKSGATLSSKSEVQPAVGSNPQKLE